MLVKSLFDVVNANGNQHTAFKFLIRLIIETILNETRIYRPMRQKDVSTAGTCSWHDLGNFGFRINIGSGQINNSIKSNYLSKFRLAKSLLRVHMYMETGALIWTGYVYYGASLSNTLIFSIPKLFCTSQTEHRFSTSNTFSGVVYYYS